LLLTAFEAQASADRLNEARLLLDAVLRQMPGGVIVVDPSSTKITLSNETAKILSSVATPKAAICGHPKPAISNDAGRGFLLLCLRMKQACFSNSHRMRSA
jgi:nitrogen fixation/metabolism regulation signal transduction histidine kinase